jgi:cytosine/adenosine deaminase-related metal-dependent hydrolase
MMSAGVNVCLGTDSVINLPSGSERISTWEEAGLLLRRDGVDARVLLRMMTVNGARGLGIEGVGFEFEGELAGLGAVSVERAEGSAERMLDAAMRAGGGVELLYRWG